MEAEPTPSRGENYPTAFYLTSSDPILPLLYLSLFVFFVAFRIDIWVSAFVSCLVQIAGCKVIELLNKENHFFLSLSCLLFVCIFPYSLASTKTNKNFTTKQDWLLCLTNIRISSIMEQDEDHYVTVSDIWCQLKVSSFYLLHTLNKEVKVNVDDFKIKMKTKMRMWEKDNWIKIEINNLHWNWREGDIKSKPCTYIGGHRYPHRQVGPKGEKYHFTISATSTTFSRKYHNHHHNW